MTVNEKIVKAAVDAANGKIATLPTKPGMCLAFVRCVIERALWNGQWVLYDKALVAGTSRRGNDPAANLREAKADPWAADLEASAKKLGWAIPAVLRTPGDIVFCHEAAKPLGHVAIVLSRNLVIENVHPNYRPNSIHLANSLSITPYEAVPWTLVARVRA